MPSLASHQSGDVCKLLYIGESGAGKTGSLVPLARAGYRLCILDFDNGLDVLAKILQSPTNLDKTPKSPAQLAIDQKALANVFFKTCTDKRKTVGGKIIPAGVPQAWSKGITMLDNWVDGDIKLGPASSWDSKTILVIDSLTLMSMAAFMHVLTLNGRAGAQPQIQDWGAAMQLIEDLLGLLYSDDIACNVIVISHITYVEREDGMSKGYPNTLGNKLPPKVGRYFNSLLLAKSKGSGDNVKRTIRTTNEGSIELKNPIPGVLPSELPLETGMLTFFEAVRGKLQV